MNEPAARLAAATGQLVALVERGQRLQECAVSLLVTYRYVWEDHSRDCGCVMCALVREVRA